MFFVVLACCLFLLSSLLLFLFQVSGGLVSEWCGVVCGSYCVGMFLFILTFCFSFFLFFFTVSQVV